MSAIGWLAESANPEFLAPAGALNELDLLGRRSIVAERGKLPPDGTDCQPIVSRRYASAP